MYGLGLWVYGPLKRNPSLLRFCISSEYFNYFSPSFINVPRGFAIYITAQLTAPIAKCHVATFIWSEAHRNDIHVCCVPPVVSLCLLMLFSQTKFGFWSKLHYREGLILYCLYLNLFVKKKVSSENITDETVLWCLMWFLLKILVCLEDYNWMVKVTEKQQKRNVLYIR